MAELITLCDIDYPETQNCNRKYVKEPKYN